MKTSKIFLLLILPLLFSCKEEVKSGMCTACCDADGNIICKGSTSEMCADYNKRKVDGHDWTFSEGIVMCPPPKPL